MLITVTVLGLLAVAVLPKVSRVTTHAKLNEATRVVASDLEQAVGIAARLRKPAVLTFVSGGLYTVRDRATSPADTVRLRRDLALVSDQGVATLAFSPTTVTIYPNGLVSAALTVTLTAADGYARTVTLSPAGLVREQ
jgi:hypothetical protein